MSKLLISNSFSVTDTFYNEVKRNGYTESHSLHNEKLCLASFKKLKVNNENFLEEAGDFVAICGTLIYREKVGGESLRLMLDDFRRNRDLRVLRKQTLGNYMCVIFMDGVLTAFCDSRNIHYLYYYSQGIDWCLSNSLYEMANAIGKDIITIDENVLLEERYSRCIWGNETVFKEIKRLEGDEYISIDVVTGNLDVKEVRCTYQVPEETFNEAVKSFSAELKRICGIVKGAFPSVSVAMTGGMDSRSVLAGLLSSWGNNTENQSIKLLYGIGNSQLVETRNEDKAVVDSVAEMFGLPLEYLDWSSPKVINQAWKDLSEKYGFLGKVYSGSPNVHQSLLERSEDFITYGYFGESYSFEDTLMNRYFTLDDFLNYYIGTRVRNIAKDYQAYRDRIAAKVKVTLSKNQIDEAKMSANDWIRLELEMRRKKDTIMVNLSNQHRYSIAILGEESLLNYAFCPVTYKKNRKFLLNMININCPKLLNVPVFSHMETRTVNKNKMELETTWIMRFRDLAKKFLKNSKLRQFAVRADKVLRGDSKSREEISKLSDTVIQLQRIYEGLPYRPHDIFSEPSTNSSLEAVYVYTAMMLQRFVK